MICNTAALWAAVVWLTVRLPPRYQMVAEFYLVVFEYVVKVRLFLIEMNRETFSKVLYAWRASAASPRKKNGAIA